MVFFLFICLEMAYISSPAPNAENTSVSNMSAIMRPENEESPMSRTNASQAEIMRPACGADAIGAANYIIALFSILPIIARHYSLSPFPLSETYVSLA